MTYAETWFSGNIARILYSEANLPSQRLSDFFAWLGEEWIQRAFFKEYFALLANKHVGTLIDSTGLPNEINCSLTGFSSHGGQGEQETRLIYVIDRSSGLPLYFRTIEGNIIDVTTIFNTIKEMEQYGINTDFALVDAGYYSEENIKFFFNSKISFLTRLLSNRNLYKNLIEQYSDELLKSSNSIVYGQRALFIKRVPITLHSYDCFAYIVLDLKRFADELSKSVIKAHDDKNYDINEIDDKIKTNGRLIFISSLEIEPIELLPLYYTRQSVENIFGILKNDLDVLPIRIHTKERFDGYMMFNFLTLIVRVLLGSHLGKNFIFEDVIMTTHNLLCKVYDKNILVNEIDAKCRKIFKQLKIEEVHSIPLPFQGS
jgi:transposase